MTESKRKTVRQKTLVAEAEKAAEKGMAPGKALEVAAKKAGLDPRAVETVREDLGLDDEGLRETFGKRIAKRYLDADDGKFPDYITNLEAVDPVQCAKLKLEYLKTMKSDLATAFITKQERHIVETDETEGRSIPEMEFRLAYHRWPSHDELQHRAAHGRWPQDMTIDASSNEDAERIN